MQRDKVKIDLLIHDLKVPLAVVEAGITSLLRRTDKYGTLTPQQEKVLVRTLRNTKVLQALVNDALELAKSREGIINVSRFTLSSFLETALVEIFDLTDCSASERIKECPDLPHLQRALEEKGLYLQVSEGLWYREVAMDEAKMRQILRNLLINALKYRRTRVDLEISEGNRTLRFSVKDDGEGIPQGLHRKIFESYFQLDASECYHVRGHGLGLAGVMVLVEDLGGTLTLESDEGKGACFSVELPIHEPTSAWGGEARKGLRA